MWQSIVKQNRTSEALEVPEAPEAHRGAYSRTCQKCNPVLALEFVGFCGISRRNEGQTNPWEGCKQCSFAGKRDKFALPRRIEHHPTIILRFIVRKYSGNQLVSNAGQDTIMRQDGGTRVTYFNDMLGICKRMLYM